MKILDVRYYNTKELVSRLRQVTMLQDREAFPYKEANIQVTKVSPHDLAPAQLYVLRSEFDKVRDLRWSLQAKGVDILKMTESYVRDGVLVSADSDRAEQLGFVEFQIEHTTLSTDIGVLNDPVKQWITVLPPIIEVSKEEDGSVANIINDGMHRCFTALISRILPHVVRIENVPKKWPYYAFPLVGGWKDVQVVDKLGILKKYHRIENYKTLYRDFNSAFTNVGGPRGNG